MGWMRHNYEPTRSEIGIIVRMHKPRGWKVKQSRRAGGLADGETKTIHVSYLHSRDALYYFLHECGHVHLEHFRHRQHIPNHVSEYEAEHYAIHTMRAWQIEPGAQLVAAARDYVAAFIRADREAGHEIDRKVERWAMREA